MFISFLRTILLYVVLVLAIRLMGKRQIGEMEPAEFVVTMLLANLAAVPMQDNAIPLLSGLVPILTILALQLLFAVLSMRFIPLRSFLCGKPTILISEGKIDQAALRNNRISTDELTEQLREKDVFDLSTVQYAILETDGELSVMLYPERRPASAAAAGISVPGTQLPYTIISEGTVLKQNLKHLGFDRKWLDKELKKLGCREKEIYLLTADKSGKILAVRREKK